MGFLQRAQERQAELSNHDSASIPLKSEDQINSESLLQKINSSPKNTNENILYSYIKKLNLQYFVLLKKIDQNYVISNSFGLDGKSIISCWATSDYWNGTLFIKNQWVTYTSNDSLFQSFNQFFSDNIFQNFSDINLNFTENYILIVPNCPKILDYSQDLNTLATILTSEYNEISEVSQENYNISVDLEEAVNSFIAANNSAKYQDIFVNCINKETSYLLHSIFKDSSLIESSNFNSSVKKINYVLDSDFPKELFIKHLILNLQNIIGKEAELISVSFN